MKIVAPHARRKSECLSMVVLVLSLVPQFNNGFVSVIVLPARLCTMEAEA